MKNKEKELSEVEKELQYSCPVLDELKHDLDSGDPVIKERALRTVNENFKLVFNWDSREYRIILKGSEVSDNEEEDGTISTDCCIFEYLLLRKTMNHFNLVPTMENIKAAFDYSRKMNRALNILRNDPDANAEIMAYKLVNKALDAISKNI
jgi:hypothetical protein